MNNTTLKLVVASAASFVAGYLVANYKNEQYYYNQANKLVDEAFGKDDLLEELQKKVDEYEAREEALKVEEAASILAEYQGQADFEPVDIHEHAAQHAAPVNEKVQYSKYSAKDAETQKPREVETPKENIELITSDQYVEAALDYDQPTYVYFRKEDILADGNLREGQGKVDSDLRAMLLGSRADLISRETFWENLGDDAFYLRNHDLKSDIEIILADDGATFENENPGDDG